MKILIINVFSTENKGDAAIVISQIAAMRAALPTAEFVVQSWNPARDSTVLDCQVVGPFFEMVSALHPDWSKPRQFAHTVAIWVKTTAAAGWFKSFGKLPRHLTPRLRELLGHYGTADLIVSVGGNFLYAFPGLNSFSFLKHCHQIRIAQIMGKPVVLFAQSLGPVTTRLHRRMLRTIVNKSDRVLVREELSVLALNALGTRSDHISVTPDTAFLLTPASCAAAEAFLEQIGVGPDVVRVGMTVRDWQYPGSADSDAKTAEFHRVIAALVDWMAVTLGARVVMLPQCISPDQDDRLCMSRVAEHVRMAAHLTVVNEDVPPDLLKAICGRFDLFIGTRMHSNIFSTAMTTPTIAISYQPKTDGIMQMLGMKKWTLPIADLTFESARSKVEALWQERDHVRETLRRRIVEIQDKARADSSALLSAYTHPEL